LSAAPFILVGPDSSRPSLAIRVTLGYSILLHALLFMIPLREKPPTVPPAAAAGPMQVRIEPLRVPPTAAVEPVAPEAPPVTRPLPRPDRTIMAMPRRAPPEPSAVTVPPPAPEPTPLRQPEFDMSALIAANRERRLARERAMAREPAAPSRGPGEAGTSSLSRNLASLTEDDGTGGIFQILRVGPRTAEFSFNGWRTQSRRKWLQVIEVEAGPDGDIERAIVRRMIALIREHKTGDFSWESHRFGRVDILSAAPEHNDQLEAYLMREFFGSPLARRGS
jgi:hypothetical protein